jgi:hypothetical protein
MTTTPPNFGNVTSPERDLKAPYDHERAATEFLDAADRINSQANAGSIPFDNNVITAAYVNATIGVGEAILAPSGAPLKIEGSEERLKIKRSEEESSL